MQNLLLGTLSTLLALLGLVMATHALDDAIFVFGLGLAIFGTAFDFLLVKWHFDEAAKAG